MRTNHTFFWPNIQYRLNQIVTDIYKKKKCFSIYYLPMTFGNFSIRNEICSALQENAFAIPLTICIMLSTFTINKFLQLKFVFKTRFKWLDGNDCFQNSDNRIAGFRKSETGTKMLNTNDLSNLVSSEIFTEENELAYLLFIFN